MRENFKFAYRDPEDEVVSVDLDSLVTELPIVIDDRGKLVHAEIDQFLPFEAKRIFVIYDVPNRSVRGQHAHFKLHEFILAVGGSVRVEVDNGYEKREFILDSPSVGLHIPPRTWRVLLDYEPTTCLFVAASEKYDADDYIRDYNEFLSLFHD